MKCFLVLKFSLEKRDPMTLKYYRKPTRQTLILAQKFNIFVKCRHIVQYMSPFSLPFPLLKQNFYLQYSTQYSSVREDIFKYSITVGNNNFSNLMLGLCLHILFTPPIYLILNDDVIIISTNSIGATYSITFGQIKCCLWSSNSSHYIRLRLAREAYFIGLTVS